MARPKSPCGTYPAYQRHLREQTQVDAACRRAQQEHDAGRGRAARRRDVAPARVTSFPAAEPLVVRRDDLRDRYLERLGALRVAVESDDLYGVIDVSVQMDDLLDGWCEAQDDVDYSLGYPRLSEDLRASLLAHREGHSAE